MACPYVDNTKGACDGWHCTITGRHVEDRSISSTYCSTQTLWKKCPHCGGDDSLHNPGGKEEEEARSESSGGSAYGYDSCSSGTETSTASGSSAKSGASGGSAGGLKLLLIFIAVVIVGGVIFCAGVWVAGKLGFLKAEYTLSVGENVDTSGMVLRAIQTGGKHKETEAAFGESGSATLELEKGTNAIYIEHDGAAIQYGFAEGDGLSIYSQQVDYDQEIALLSIRVLILRFTDIYGDAVDGESGYVLDADGVRHDCYGLADGTYAVVLPNDIGDADLNLTVPGYENMLLTADMRETRILRLGVTLTPAGEEAEHG